MLEPEVLVARLLEGGIVRRIMPVADALQRAVKMDGVVVEKGGWVAAGALVTPNKRIPAGEIWAGNPAKFFRKMTAEEVDFVPVSAANYVKHAREYLAMRK